MKCPDCGEEIIKHECKKPDYVFTDIKSYYDFLNFLKNNPGIRNIRTKDDYNGIKVWLT